VVVVGRVRASVVALVVLALAAAAGWWVSGMARADVRGPLGSAMAAAPADTTVLGLTDWDRVRAVAGGDPDARDLTTRSVLDDLGDALPSALGWSTDDVRWEALVQDPGAGVLVVAPGPGLSFSDLADGFRAAGYDDDGDGAWSASPDVLVRTGLTDQLTEVRLVPRAGVLVAGTTSGPVEEVVRSATGRAPSLTSVRRAVDTARALAGADTVLLQAGSLGCEGAAVPPEVRDQADAAQARAGRLAPYVFAGRALTDRGGSGASAQTATFAMTFDDVARARRQAPVRERLSTGPFIGRSGQVEDELRHPRATVDQATVVLAFDRAADGTVLMLGTGALLFASC
jgi:hypothetical protein